MTPNLLTHNSTNHITGATFDLRPAETTQMHDLKGRRYATHTADDESDTAVNLHSLAETQEHLGSPQPLYI